MSWVLLLLVPFLVTYLLISPLRKLAVKFRILDLPNRRSAHKRATPLLGGVAIYLGLLAGFFLHLRGLGYFMPLVISATIIVGVGLADDIKGLSARSRLLVQILVSLILIKSGFHVSFLPQSLWGNLGQGIITVFWIVGVINAYNYLDGLDGLAAGSAIVNSLCFAIILYKTGQQPLVMLLLIIIGSCLGFLPYNFRKAKMFLGDAGSTLLGFLMASVALTGNWAQDNIVKISIPLLILGVPIFDMVFTTIMRIKEGKVKTLIEWLEYCGKDHFHHYLVDIGLSKLGAVVFIYFVSLSLGINAIMVSNDSAFEGFLSLGQAGMIFAMIAILIVIGKRRRSGWN